MTLSISFHISLSLSVFCFHPPEDCIHLVCVVVCTLCFIYKRTYLIPQAASSSTTCSSIGLSTRRKSLLPVGDPKSDFATAAMGVFTESLSIAAAHYGFAVKKTEIIAKPDHTVEEIKPFARLALLPIERINLLK